MPSGASRPTANGSSDGAEAGGRNSGRRASRRTALSQEGDHTTSWSSADRPGLAAKSQPPELFRIFRKRCGLGGGAHKTAVKLLIRNESAKTFPGEIFDLQAIEIVVTAVVPPVSCIWPHSVNSSQVTRKSNAEFSCFIIGGGRPGEDIA